MKILFLDSPAFAKHVIFNTICFFTMITMNAKVRRLKLLFLLL